MLSAIVVMMCMLPVHHTATYYVSAPHLVDMYLETKPTIRSGSSSRGRGKLFMAEFRNQQDIPAQLNPALGPCRVLFVLIKSDKIPGRRGRKPWMENGPELQRWDANVPARQFVADVMDVITITSDVNGKPFSRSHPQNFFTTTSSGVGGLYAPTTWSSTGGPVAAILFSNLCTQDEVTHKRAQRRRANAKYYMRIRRKRGCGVTASSATEEGRVRGEGGGGGGGGGVRGGGEDGGGAGGAGGNRGGGGAGEADRTGGGRHSDTATQRHSDTATQ
eukprot:3936517-Rhodomonas_salina.1